MTMQDEASDKNEDNGDSIKGVTSFSGGFTVSDELRIILLIRSKLKSTNV